MKEVKLDIDYGGTEVKAYRKDKEIWVKAAEVSTITHPARPDEPAKIALGFWEERVLPITLLDRIRRRGNIISKTIWAKRSATRWAKKQASRTHIVNTYHVGSR